jgi:superfamily I DNA and/or RNA helicase
MQIATLNEYYSKEQFPSIAVISPYQEQIRLLREQLKGYAEIAALGDRVAVNTIDSFQGQERDIVYISMARSNPRGEIGFLADVRRMNVAMTRAKQKLVIVGDSSTLGQAVFYKDFIAYAESVNGYHSAWEFMND